MFRPQFAFPTPRGFEDHDIVQYFDYLNNGRLNNTALATLGIIQDVPLTLLPDYPFFWRGIEIQSINAGDPVVSIQFKDPSRNLLSNDYLPIDLYARPAGLGIVGTPPVALEPEIPCPRGSVVWVSIFNQTGSNQDITKVRIALSGVQRCPVGVRRAA